MEFANENAYLSQDRINLKNKSPFDHSKKSNKKALADVGNVIRSKGTSSFGIKSTHQIYGKTFDQQKSLKSPGLQNKIVQKPQKLALLENMDEEFFTCPCVSHIHDDFSYELPSSMQLSKDEIDIFATRWSNPAPLECNDDFDVSLEIIPVSISDDFLADDDSMSSSFMDVLNESLDYVCELPEITLQL